METLQVSFPQDTMRPPVFVSRIKLFGIPIIGPCMNEAKRAEMRALRVKAVEVERRLSKKIDIKTDSPDACKSQVALTQTACASNDRDLVPNETSLASKEATTTSLHSIDAISNPALVIEIHSPSSSTCTASASSLNPEPNQLTEPTDFTKSYLSFPPLDPDNTIEGQLCFRPDADSSGSVDLNMDLTASSVCSPHRPHDLSLLENIRAPDVNLVSPGLNECRQRIDFKKCFRDFLTKKLAELDPDACQDTVTDFSQPIEHIEAAPAVDFSNDPTPASDSLDVPPLLVRQNSYTLLDGPTPLIIAHVERNIPPTSTPNHSARNSATNESPRISKSNRVGRTLSTNHSPRFSSVGSPATNRGSARRSSSQDSVSSNRSPALAPGAGLRRRGWDFDNARAFWASSDALDRMFSVPRVKPVSVPPKPRGPKGSGANASGNVSLPTSANSSPAKSMHRFEAFSSLDALSSPAVSRPIRRSLFSKPANQTPARAIETSHWSSPRRQSTPPRRDSRGSASLVKNIIPGHETMTSNREITPIGTPDSTYNAVGSVDFDRNGISSPNYASDARASVCSSQNGSDFPKSVHSVICSPNYTSDIAGSVCSSRDDVVESPKPHNVICSPSYNVIESKCSSRDEIINSPKSQGDFPTYNNNVIGSVCTSRDCISSQKSPHVVIHSPISRYDLVDSPESQPSVIDTPKSLDTIASLTDTIVPGDLTAAAESPFERLQREHLRQMALLVERHRADAERLRQEFAEQERRLMAAFGHSAVMSETDQLQDSATVSAPTAPKTSKLVAVAVGPLAINATSVTSAQRDSITARNSFNARDSASLSGEKENVCDWYASSELSSLPRAGARRGDHAFRELHMNGQTAVSVLSRSSSRSSEGTVSSDGFAESCASWQLRHNSPAADTRPVPTEREKRAAAVIVGAARGFLVRRLLRTAHVRDIRTTIRDVTLATLQLHTENHDALRPEDVELGRRFIHQLNASWLELYETFFVLPTEKKLALIAADRARIGARATPASGRLSSATERFRRRKQAGSTSPAISHQSSRPTSAVSTISAVSRNSIRTVTPRLSANVTPRAEQSQRKPWR